ncbi:MAG: hypothetical protein RLZZ271_1616, partial [Pseudomonadota bacterium]
MHSRHHWDIFCRVIDNYGDAGVCWRLARDLASRGKTVHLWIDDATPLSWMAPQGCAGVTVHNWQDAPQHYEPGQAIIEAFGCELDDAVKAKLAQAARTKDPARPEPDSVHPELVEGQPTWINLEYLSAEDYVRRSHGLPSPQMSGPAKGLTKHFFYPGFTEGTGGLIREQNLVERQQNFKPEPWLQSQGIPLSPNALRVSLFCYEPPALAQLIAQLQALPRPTQLLVTHGRSTTHCRQTLARIGLPEHGAGTLQIIYLPALTQDDYDHLLWSCDLNFVRGEDSLVRAIWTGIPFVWNIYPQDDGAHVAKLRAFMNLMPLSAAQRGWFEGWNEAGSGRLGALDELLQADASSMTMLRNMSMPSDLANQLMEFALAENSIHE